MYKQYELDFYDGLPNNDLFDQIAEITKEIDTTTEYMRSLLYDMKTLDMVDSIFDKLYK